MPPEDADGDADHCSQTSPLRHAPIRPIREDSPDIGAEWFDAALEIDGVRSAIRMVGTCPTRSNGFAGKLLHPHAHERWIPPL
jgi:hypothetical protein